MRGGLPGYPESHGCVHLPSEFARLLFDMSTMGMTVVICCRSRRAEPCLLIQELITPVDAKGRVLPHRPLQASRVFALAARAVAHRSGQHRAQSRQRTRSSSIAPASRSVGRAQSSAVPEPIGTHVLTLVAGAGQQRATVRAQTRSGALDTSGAGRSRGREGQRAGAGRRPIASTFRREFVRRVFDVLALGTTVLVTDEPITPQTTGPSLDVINADAPES